MEEPELVIQLDSPSPLLAHYYVLISLGELCLMLQGLKMSGITKDYISIKYTKDSIVFSGRRKMLEYTLVKETIDNGDVVRSS